MYIRSYYKYYYLNTRGVIKKIHSSECVFFPKNKGVIYIGFFATYVPALNAAKKLGYDNTNCCFFCCRK